MCSRIISLLLFALFLMKANAQNMLESISALEGYVQYTTGLKAYEDSLLYYRTEVAGNYTPAERKIILEKYAGAIKTYKNKLAGFITAHKHDAWSAIALLSAIYAQAENDLSILQQYADTIRTYAPETKYQAALKEIVNARKTVAAKHAADFTLPDNNGKTLALSGVKGKLMVLNFWASWCGPCRQKNVQLKQLYNAYKSKGLEIVAVSLDQNKYAWLNALKQDQANWINLLAQHGFQSNAALAYNVYGVPKTFLLDGNGNILDSDLQITELVKCLQAL